MSETYDSVPQSWRQSFGIEMDMLDNAGPDSNPNLTSEESVQNATELLRNCLEECPFARQIISFVLTKSLTIAEIGDSSEESITLSAGRYEAELYDFCLVDETYDSSQSDRGSEDEAADYQLGLHLVFDKGSYQEEVVILAKDVKNVELARATDIFVCEKDLFSKCLPELTESSDLDGRYTNYQAGVMESKVKNFINSTSRLIGAEIAICFVDLADAETMVEPAVRDSFGDDDSDDEINTMSEYVRGWLEGRVVEFVIEFDESENEGRYDEPILMVVLEQQHTDDDGIVMVETTKYPVTCIDDGRILASSHWN